MPHDSSRLRRQEDIACCGEAAPERPRQSWKTRSRSARETATHKMLGEARRPLSFPSERTLDLTAQRKRDEAQARRSRAGTTQTVLEDQITNHDADDARARCCLGLSSSAAFPFACSPNDTSAPTGEASSSRFRAMRF